MRLTTAKYFTPSGRSIQATGIVPDIIVKQSKVEEIELNSFSERRESDLRGHLDNPKEESEDPSEIAKDNSNEDINKSDFIDYQLDRALDLLEGISLYNKDHV